jgi:hypothetical protein
MPYKMLKTKEGYTTSSPTKVHGRGMTKENAQSQIRLLNAVEHNPEFAAMLRKGKGKSKVARPKI